MKLGKHLSDRTFTITSEEDLQDWLRAVDREIGGISWVPLGAIDNNVHTVEVASDAALALVERPTNSIDALLDLKARQRGETARTPHQAAMQWWGVPAGGLSDMTDKSRRELADHIRVTMVESGDPQRPTIIIQDKGTGQHPDDFSKTHLSLLGSNKKSSTHVMGVYNAGGAASYKFAKAAIIISRLAPDLLNGRADEIGVTVVRYDPLDPEKYKSGMYVYAVAKDKSILRVGLPEMPEFGYGSYIKLVEYELTRYARGAHEPKQSLWHLFHAALPDPALPFRIIETRVDRFKGMKGTVERRVVSGLLHLLRNPGTAAYSDERILDLGPDTGTVVLRYFVLNEGTEPDAYTTSEQGLTVTLNGQRQITKDRHWLRRQVDLFFLFKRLVVLVDGTGLTSRSKRTVFSSTREHGVVDSPLANSILDRVVRELRDDENLYSLDEQAKQRTLEAATKTTSEKVKKLLASEIMSHLKGQMVGLKGGLKKKPKKRPRKPRPPRPIPDDSFLPDLPDKLVIVDKPLEIEQGTTGPLWLEINAKNGFLPKYSSCLSIVIGPELKDHVKVISKGRLLGGRVRVTLEAAAESPTISTPVKVALVIPELGVLLTDDGMIDVKPPEEEPKPGDDNKGGEPNVDINWVGRDKWDTFDPSWDEQTVGECLIYRDDPTDKEAITKVEWNLNEAFGPYEKVTAEKRLTDESLKTFRDGYAFPLALGLFKQRLAEEAKEREADEEGRRVEIPDDYVKGEKGRMARAVLMAMEPEVRLAEAAAT